jgi:hypothetical protein
MKRALPVLLLALAAHFAATTARADVAWAAPPIFIPVPTALTLQPLIGEPLGAAGGLAPPLAVLPLRLSLLWTARPLAAALPGDPCASREGASGNSQSGFPVQHQVYLAMTSRLVLHGFSRLGCPLDAKVAAGVTYTVPIAHGVWIVPSAGGFARTSLGQGRIVSTGQARVDLLMNTSNDRTLGIGVVKKGGRQGVQLTGTW